MGTRARARPQFWGEVRKRHLMVLFSAFYNGLNIVKKKWEGEMVPPGDFCP